METKSKSCRKEITTIFYISYSVSLIHRCPWIVGRMKNKKSTEEYINYRSVLSKLIKLNRAV
jgi:hypothetical protein